MNTFQPDLIVEVTAACNRSCAGCYAPNVVTNKPATDLFFERPELFLGIVNFNRALNNIAKMPYWTAIRGGEPSLHPKLSTLLIMAKTKSYKVALETHGRWLLPESIKEHKELIETIKSKEIVVKISFDKMHGLKKEELHKITQFLEWHLIDYRIAITESNLVDFSISRGLCSWIADEKIIYQPKAKSSNELVIPSIGVINVKGEFQENLTHKLENTEVLGMAL